LRRQDHHAQLRAAALGAAEHLEAVQVGQLQVEHHDPDPGIREALERLLAAGCQLDLEAGGLEGVANRFAEEALVVHHQDAYVAHRPHRI
jgi:hypothetical protein